MEVGIIIRNMKRLTAILIASFCIMPMFAQLNGNGYYRIQNVGSSRYMSIVNDRADATNKNAIKSGGSGNVFALKTVKDYSKIVSDPGSIVYMEKNGTSGSEYNLKGQGMYTYTLTGGMSLKVYDTKDGNNSYWLYGAQAGMTRFLQDIESTNDEENIKITSERDKAICKWFIKPIDQTNEYLGITPDVTIGDKHYTTIYYSFPIKLSSGMKAYYVKNTFAGTGIVNQVAEMAEIADGIVPAKTPAIIECNSTDPADNKVTLLNEGEVTASYKNDLKGVFFSYVKLTLSGKENTTDLGKQLKNATTYDANTMRVLGIVDGKLGFVKASESNLNLGQYLPANKAYLPVYSAGDNITLVDAAQYSAGIENLTNDQTTKDSKVYSLDGICVGNENNFEELPNGIYIVNGKKMVKN